MGTLVRSLSYPLSIVVLVYVLGSTHFLTQTNAQEQPGSRNCSVCTSPSGHSANCVLNSTTFQCMVNTHGCKFEQCPSMDICTFFYHGNGDNISALSWTFTSECFEPEPTKCTPRESADPSSSPLINCHTDSDCSGDYCRGIVNHDFDVTNLLTPSTSPVSVSTTEMITTNSTTVGPTNATPASAYVIAIGVFVAILLLIFVIVCLGIIFYKLRQKFATLYQRNNTRTRQTSFENPINNQPWQLLGLVGQGRYAYVYKANYQGKIVAVKMFMTNNRTAWENERNLYSMESTAHENVAEYITSEIRGSGIALQRVLVTQFYAHGSLNNYLKSQSVTWNQACVMIHSIALGLAHLHSEYYVNYGGIVAEKYPIAHRDVKSANILVRSDRGDCVISDLGFALILDPSVDSKQMANAGQAGTYRYMAPEALDARVDLQDLQSFKQIDVYAFALMMWEIMSRTCVLTEEDVPNYRLPYEEEAGLRPTLDRLKDIVVTRALRPSLPAIWGNHEHLSSLQETLHDCWDNDPEARLSAANVAIRMHELCETNIDDITRPDTSPAVTIPHTITTGTSTIAMIEIHRPTEHSQSSPPPYYSPTDPAPFHGQHTAFPFVSGPVLTPQRRQASMPHMLSGSNEPLRGSTYASGRQGYHMTARCTRSLRSSFHYEQEMLRLNNYNSSEALSLRNSLLLNSGNEHENIETSVVEEQIDEIVRELSQSPRGCSLEASDRLNTSDDDNLVEESFPTVCSVQCEDDASLDGRELGPSLAFLHSDDSELSSNLNSDSGFVNPHSDASHSNRTTASYNDLSSDESVSSTSSHDLFTDSQDSGPPLQLDNMSRSVAERTTPIVNAELLRPSENSGNSVSTVTSV